MSDSSNGSAPDLGFGNEFQAQAEQELRRLKATLHDLEEELAKLQRKRNRVAEAVAHLQGLQGFLHLKDDGAPTDVDTPVPPSQSRRETDADRVVDYLQEIGKPMHYRQIYDGLHKRGLDVGGKDPANTLLSRYFNDPRLERVGRGTYALKR